MKIDNLSIKISESRISMGIQAASEAAICLKQLLKEKDIANIIFAAAPSQNEFLDALTQMEDIDWKRVNAFHMDEYIGLGKDAPQGFGNFLQRHIFSKVPFRNVFFLNGQAETYKKRVRNIRHSYKTTLLILYSWESEKMDTLLLTTLMWQTFRIHIW